MTQHEARMIVHAELVKRGRTWGDETIQAEALAEMRRELAKAERAPGDWRTRRWGAGRIPVGNGAYRVRCGGQS